MKDNNNPVIHYIIVIAIAACVLAIVFAVVLR